MAEYIDREKLRMYPLRWEFCDKENADPLFIYGVESLMEYVEWLPAADVAPVVHGRWIPCTESEITGWDPNLAGRDPLGGYFCSICHYEAIFSCNDEYVLSDYCPACGAKMDGKDEDDGQKD